MTLYHPALTQAVALEHIRDLRRGAVDRRIRLEAATAAGVTDIAPRHRVPRHRPLWWLRVTSIVTRPLHAAGRVSILLTVAVTAVTVLLGAGAAWAGPAPVEPGSSGSEHGRAAADRLGRQLPDGGSSVSSSSSTDLSWVMYVGATALVLLVLTLAVAGSLAIARHRRPALPTA